MRHLLIWRWLQVQQGRYDSNEPSLGRAWMRSPSRASCLAKALLLTQYCWATNSPFWVVALVREDVVLCEFFWFFAFGAFHLLQKIGWPSWWVLLWAPFHKSSSFKCGSSKLTFGTKNRKERTTQIKKQGFIQIWLSGLYISKGAQRATGHSKAIRRFEISPHPHHHPVEEVIQLVFPFSFRLKSCSS